MAHTNTQQGYSKFGSVHALKAHRQLLQLHSFSTSALDGEDWKNSRSDRFTPDYSVSRVHWVEGWVGSGRFGQDSISSFWQEWNPDRPDRSLVAISTDLS
jgi:hypothetical protein